MTDEFEDCPRVDDAGAKPIDLTAVRQEIRRLAGLDSLGYDLGRREAARQLGIPLRSLDREVEAERSRTGTAKGTDPSIVETLEPWPGDVDGVLLAEKMRRHLRAHVVFERPEDADAVVLWTLAVYALNAWAIFPKLLVGSPAMRSGKTTLLRLVEAFAPRPFLTSNMTAPTLFRLIDQFQPCLILDEADRFMENTPELIGLINASHVRRSAFALRCVEVAGEQTLRRFTTWCPMVVAGIGRRDDTIEDRGVAVTLFRRTADQPVERLPVDFFERQTDTRRQLLAWAEDVQDALAVMTCEPPDAGNDRRRDNWTPLWRVAEALGGAWPDRAVAAYLAAAAAEQAEEPEGDAEKLLQDLAEVFETRSWATHLKTEDVRDALIALGPDRPLYDWQDRGRPVSGNTLGKLARRFGIGPVQVKQDGRNLRLWPRAAVERAMRSYRPPQGEKTRYSATALNTKDNHSNTAEPDNILINNNNIEEEKKRENDKSVRDQRGSGVAEMNPVPTRYSGTENPVPPGLGDPPDTDWELF